MQPFFRHDLNAPSQEQPGVGAAKKYPLLNRQVMVFEEAEKEIADSELTFSRQQKRTAYMRTRSLYETSKYVFFAPLNWGS
jgi:hypothetical protein